MKLSLGLRVSEPFPTSYGKGITKANGETCVLYAAQFSGPSIQGRSPAKCSCCYWYAVDDIHPICCEYRPLSSNGSRNRHGQAKRGPLLQQWN